MSAASVRQCVDIPDDPALPGLARCAQPDQMIEHVRAAVAGLGAGDSADYGDCSLTEAVYQPGRACRIAYALSARGVDRPDIVYARWPAEKRTHASAIRVESNGDSFDLFRFPRDRRLRQIRPLRRDEWLKDASAAWFALKHGEGCFTPGSWRCTPIKYVPESRLVCRLKGEWETRLGVTWCRAYVRISRRSNAGAQSEVLQRLTTALNQVDCGLAVPGVLGTVSRHHLLATEFIRGRMLRETIGGMSLAEIADAFRKLASISRLKFDLVPVRADEERLEPQLMLADLGSVLRLSSGSSRTLAVWASTHPARPYVETLVHGDLHTGQVIQKNDRLFVVDWDAHRLGDATQDITNLAAEVDCASLFTRDEGSADRVAGACVDAWRSAGGAFNTPSARWWAARAIVLRAWGLLRHLRPGWREATSRLLDRASDIYSGGADWTD